MASYKVCEYGKYNPPRCRKRATVAIGYRVLFASLMNMHGPDGKTYAAAYAADAYAADDAAYAAYAAEADVKINFVRIAQKTVKEF